MSFELEGSLCQVFFAKHSLPSSLVLEKFFLLDSAISHTIVDIIAHFEVKKHVTDPERKGIKPNPNYYAEVPKLCPIFENCAENTYQYQNFDEILNRITL